MEMKDVLVRPIVTEKSTTNLPENTFAFQVGLGANKVQIKRAVERFYGVRVRTVRTLVVRGKMKRFGRRQAKRSNWKKAYVTLADGHTINIYEA